MGAGHGGTRDLEVECEVSDDEGLDLGSENLWNPGPDLHQPCDLRQVLLVFSRMKWEVFPLLGVFVRPGHDGSIQGPSMGLSAVSAQAPAFLYPERP